MKGADQCPRCASRKWAQPGIPSPEGFYSDDVRVCANCRTIWEPFDQADLLDPGQQLSSFMHPCNNCAFRKGSPEQRDPEAFAHLRAKLGWCAGRFYCHKGVPVNPKNENGFDYPDDGRTQRKLRPCRGFLNQLGTFPLDRAAQAALDDPGQPWVDVLAETATQSETCDE